MPTSSADPNAFVALGVQSALGTPQVTLAKLRFLKYLEGTNVQPQQEVVHLREGGDGLDFGYSYKNRQHVEGQIVANARLDALGQILSIVPGGATWDGGSAPAVHTFLTNHASHPWATLLVQHPGSSLPNLISDVRFRSVQFEFGPGNAPVKVTAPFIGINHGASMAAIAPTYHSIEAPVHYANNPSYQVDGVADTDIQSFTVTFELGIEESQTQDVLLDELIVQNRDAMLEIQKRYENPVLWQKVYYGHGSAVTPTTSVATGSFRGFVTNGLATSSLRSLDVSLPLVAYEGNELSELNPDGVSVTEAITAKPLKGATTMGILQLKNAHASAYAA